MSYFPEKTYNLDEKYVFSGLVFQRDINHPWGKYKGYGYFNNLILEGNKEDVFLEQMREYTLERVHIRLSFSILFKYIAYTLLCLSILSFFGHVLILFLPASSIIFFILSHFIFRKAVRDYISLDDEEFPNTVRYLFKRKLLLVFTFREQLTRAYYFLFYW
jgi:hypothetical protein